MYFLYPIGLFALASLIFPIIIHLWKVKQGKTLKIGSITLLGESAASNARSVQISDWLLLLLRCLFIILLAFILAKPFTKGEPIAKTQRGWIVLNQNDLKYIYPVHRKKIDSLLKNGFVIHHFGQGFKPLKLSDTANFESRNKKAERLNYTSLLKQLNHILPDEFPLWVFSDRDPQKLDAILPNLHLSIFWQDLNPINLEMPSKSQFIGDESQVKIAKNAVTYSRLNSKSLPALNFQILPVNSGDTQYLKAALMAIGQYREQKINFPTGKTQQKHLDGLFWLSEKEIPKDISSQVKDDGFVFRYSSGKARENQSTISFGNTSDETQVQVFKTITKTAEKGKVWWTDSYGNTLLSYKEGTPGTFIFYSKLSPQWSNLVWNENFPGNLMPIIYQVEPRGFGFDTRYSFKPSANEPLALFHKDGKTYSSSTPDQSFSKPLWAIAFLIIAIERILTLKRKKSIKTA